MLWHNINNITLALEKVLVHPITAILMSISNSISNSCMPLKTNVCAVAAVKGVVFKTKVLNSWGRVDKINFIDVE